MMDEHREWMRGCATAMVTPFTLDGAVDHERMRHLVDHQIEGGVRILVPCGTTGEGATLTEDEQTELIATVVRHAKGRARVIAGVGSNATTTVIERARRAAEVGADAVLVVAPYYNKPTQEGLFAHFRAVAEAVQNTPVVLYNVPSRTACNISAEVTIALARDVPNVVGTKEASGDLAQVTAILRDRPSSFAVLSGDDATTVPLIAMGADGVVSVAANEVPDAMHRLAEAALENDWDTARELHYRLAELMHANFIETNPGPVKACMSMMGLAEESVRLPLVPVRDATRSRLRAVLDALQLLPVSAHVTA
jgi:4-hydroxy-tetrahydrodipicolinate synthase